MDALSRENEQLDCGNQTNVGNLQCHWWFLGMTPKKGSAALDHER